MLSSTPLKIILLFCFKKIKIKIFFLNPSEMERRAQISINPITAAVDRADQITTCCLISLASHSRTNWDTRAVSSTSPNSNPRLQPPRDALPASFCQLGFATFHSADRTCFVFSKYNKQMHRNRNPWVTSGWKQVESASAISGSQGGSEVSGGIRGVQQLTLGLLPQPLPRGTGLVLIEPWWSCNKSPH